MYHHSKWTDPAPRTKPENLRDSFQIYNPLAIRVRMFANYFFCNKNMHHLQTSVHLRVKHHFIKCKAARYVSSILPDVLPEQRGKPNAVTSHQVQQHFRSSTGPASSLPETGVGEGRKGARRHALHFYSEAFPAIEELGSVLHFGLYLFLFNIKVVQNCCKFKSHRTTEYDKGSARSKKNKPPPDFGFSRTADGPETRVVSKLSSGMY